MVNKYCEFAYNKETQTHFIMKFKSVYSERNSTTHTSTVVMALSVLMFTIVVTNC